MLKHGHVIVRRCNLPVSYETERIAFENIQVSVLKNAKEWLAARYGADFMIPNPDFRDTGKEKNIYYWDDVKATYKHFD